MADHHDDMTLVQRMLDGDEDAFDRFAGRYLQALLRFALARLEGDRETAREVVQTAACKALARLDTYRGEASLYTWLCACCRNEIRMHFRRLRSRPQEVELDDRMAPGPSLGGGRGDPEAAVLRREVGHRVHLALDLLPERYGRALEWKYVEHLTVAEIAARLEVTGKAAESLLSRARAAFRESYRQVTEEPGVVGPEGEWEPKERSHG